MLVLPWQRKNHWPNTSDQLEVEVPSEDTSGGFLKLGVPFWGSHNEDYSIWGSILGSPCLGKLPSSSLKGSVWKGYLCFCPVQALPGLHGRSHTDQPGPIASQNLVTGPWLATTIFLLHKPPGVTATSARVAVAEATTAISGPVQQKIEFRLSAWTRPTKHTDS